MMLNQYKKSSALQPPGGDKTQQVNENKMQMLRVGSSTAPNVLCEDSPKRRDVAQQFYC